MMNRFKYRAFSATAPHNRDLPKPTEDFVLADPEQGIYMVLDGITRVHEEYEQAPFESAACRANQIFSEAVYRYLLENQHQAEPSALLRSAILSANALLRDFRASRSLEEWGFYPGTLGIVGLVRSDRFYYASLGDCMGVLLRGSSALCFGTQDTVRAVELLALSKEERYAGYCNHPESDLCYGVFNGDEAVEATLEEAWFDLTGGDVLLLASDGISDYLKYERPAVLRQKTPEEMLEASRRFDAPPFRRYADDKGIVKITVS